MNNWLVSQSYGELLLQGLTPANAAGLIASKLHFPPMVRIKSLIEQGLPVSKAFRLIDTGLSKTDVILIEAGEFSGQLPQAFLAIARAQKFNRSLRIKLVMGLLYPSFLIGIAVMMYPASDIQLLIQNHGVSTVIIRKGMVFLCYLGFLLAVFFTGQRLTLSYWENFMLNTIGLRSLWRSYICSQVTISMAWLLKTQLSIGDIWVMTANATSSALLKAEAAVWNQKGRAGINPDISTSNVIDQHFIGSYSLAVETGLTPEKMEELQSYYDSRVQKGMLSLLAFTSLIATIVGITLISATIIQLYVGYWDGMLQLLK